MGAYLSEPVTEKISNDESSKRLSYGASSMQGWRISQEDAHNCIIDFDTSDMSFFAVYDGHGGPEVAKYCSANLPDCLRSTAEYKKGNMSQALEDAFLEFDQCLTKDEVISEMKQIAGLPTDSDDSDEDAAALHEEASLPLDEVLARYETTAVKKLAPHVKGYDQPKSPMLRGKKAEPGDDLNGVPSSDDTGKDVEETKSVNGEIVNKSEDCISETKDKAKPGKVFDVTSEEKTTKATNKKEKVVEKNDAVQAGCSSGGSSRKKPSKKGSFTVTKESSSGEEDSEDDEEFKADSNSSEEESQGDESNSEEDEEEESESDDSEEDDIDMVSTNQMGSEEEPGSDSGCTAVVALLKGNQLYVANAGDSRCVVCREGKALNLSIDHKPEDQVERDRIVNAGGQVTSDGRVNGGLNLSRALGDHAYKANEELSAREQMITALPDIQTLILDPKEDKYMILACDGIWNSLSSQEVVDFVEERMNEDIKLSSICDQLLDHCLAPDTSGDGTGCDNMTVIIVKFHNLDSEWNKRSLESNGQASVPETPAPKKMKLEESSQNA